MEILITLQGKPFGTFVDQGIFPVEDQPIGKVIMFPAWNIPLEVLGYFEKLLTKGFIHGSYEYTAHVWFNFKVI